MSTVSLPCLDPEVEIAVKAAMLGLNYTAWAIGETLAYAASRGFLDGCEVLDSADVPALDSLLDPWTPFDGFRWALGPKGGAW
jgi:hypothetical protein